MKPKEVMGFCPIEGNPMAVRMYPTGGRVLAVMGASGGTNIPDQSSSDCPDLSVYLREDLSVCVAAVSLKTGVRWNSMFVRVQLKDGRAVAEMEEPFVHPRYPTTFDGWRVCVQVAGEWYATTTLNLVGKVVTAESICKLLAGIMSEDEFISSANGESLAEKMERLQALEDQVRKVAATCSRGGAWDEKPVALLRDALQHQQELLNTRHETIEVLVRLLNRVANEGCSLPDLNEAHARTSTDWLGRSATKWSVRGDVFEDWIAKMRQRAEDSHRFERESRFAQKHLDMYKDTLFQVSRCALARPVTRAELHGAVISPEPGGSWSERCEMGIQRQIEMAHTRDEKLLVALKGELGRLIPGLRQLQEEVTQRRLPYLPQTMRARLEKVLPPLAR